ncbi:Aminoacyl tRNA synthase complex-interacting multifunctional protein 1 [Papilio machaon]|uniref:Aminoacyl tRNA synthase complex-interacting multifunctional protein 1 n=1 Tax=Papilio machaon TaxID=76193 RepID=A0A194QMN6_PAPMA|nr:Aminoacyl tRNA synthase complex-interacting multifunctional protein 1 [Papilio machaon]
MLNKISSNILANAETAEKRLADLRRKVEDIKKFKVEEKIQELIKENSVLSEKIIQAKNELIKLEISHGKKQYSVPSKEITKSNVVSICIEKPQDKSSEVENAQPTAPKKEKNSVKKIKEKVNPNPSTDNIIDMRGVTSEAMVMCASSPEKVEVLNPPSDAIPGEDLALLCQG